jgi:site-specific DNA-methyltransferase (adenine-specific)
MESKPISLVYNCDCVEYMRTLPDCKFNLAIADPPYSHLNSDTFMKNGRFHKGRFDRYRKVDGCSIDIDEWDKTPADEFFEQLFRVSQNQIIWGANYFDGMPATRCFVVWKKQIPENFSMAMCEYAWTSFSGNAKIIDFSQLSKKGDTRFHPTQKPIELYGWLLRNFAKEGDIIFDPMMGSQSSRIAAYKMGFDYIGCEIEPLYFNKGNERFDKVCHGEFKTNNGYIVKQLSLFGK